VIARPTPPPQPLAQWMHGAGYIGPPARPVHRPAGHNQPKISHTHTHFGKEYSEFKTVKKSDAKNAKGSTRSAFFGITNILIFCCDYP
jgi:hypothetical protein